MKQMKLSVIVPVHNGEKTIKKCLQSLIHQTIEVDEIVAVIDHSNDRTHEIITEIAKRHKNIICVCSDGMGVSAARNTGMRVASGDIIGFCDSDDTEKPNMSEIVKSNFFAYPKIKLLITGYEKWNDKQIRKAQKKRIYGFRGWSINDVMKHVIYDENIMGSVCNKFFLKSYLKKVRFDESLSLCEDKEFLLRYLLLCDISDVIITSAITYRYIYNNMSATNDRKLLFLNKSNELRYNYAFRKMLEIPNLPKDVKPYLYYNIFAFSIAIISYYKMNPKREILLKRNIYKYFSDFIKLFYLEPYTNCKRLFKTVFKIRRNRPFCW